MRRWAQARNLEITNEFRVRSKSAIADLDSDIAELGKPGFARFTRARNDDLPSALVRFFASGNLFDQIDNAAPEFAVGNARERAG
jgi:hypothetical protein